MIRSLGGGIGAGAGIGSADGSASGSNGGSKSKSLEIGAATHSFGEILVPTGGRRRIEGGGGGISGLGGLAGEIRPGQFGRSVFCAAANVPHRQAAIISVMTVRNRNTKSSRNPPRSNHLCAGYLRNEKSVKSNRNQTPGQGRMMLR